MAGQIADHRSAVKRCRLQICTSGFEQYCAYPEELKNIQNIQSNNGDKSNILNFTVGTSIVNGYVQGNSTESADGNKESNVAVGVEVATPEIKIDQDKTSSIKAYGEIQFNTGGN